MNEPKHQVRDSIAYASGEEDFNGMARLAFRQRARFSKKTQRNMGGPQDRARGARLKISVAEARASFSEFI